MFNYNLKKPGVKPPSCWSFPHGDRRAGGSGETKGASLEPVVWFLRTRCSRQWRPVRFGLAGVSRRISSSVISSSRAARRGRPARLLHGLLRESLRRILSRKQRYVFLRGGALRGPVRCALALNTECTFKVCRGEFPLRKSPEELSGAQTSTRPRVAQKKNRVQSKRNCRRETKQRISVLKN